MSTMDPLHTYIAPIEVVGCSSSIIAPSKFEHMIDCRSELCALNSGACFAPLLQLFFSFESVGLRTERTNK